MYFSALIHHLTQIQTKTKLLMQIQIAVKTTFYVIVYFSKFRYQWTKIPFYFMGIALVFLFIFIGSYCTRALNPAIQYKNTNDLNVFNQSEGLS